MQKFEQQYNRLGLKVPENPMNPRDKADQIFHAACLVVGIEPDQLPQVYNLLEEFHASLTGFYKLQVVRKALAADRKPNWNKPEKKYGPWFWMDDPGFRLGGVFCDFGLTRATSGSRLCLFDEEDGEFFATECIAFWADFMGEELAA